jgi:hypothetical protein
MPPQQSNRPLDVFDQFFGFCAHESSNLSCCRADVATAAPPRNRAFRPPAACRLAAACCLPPPDGMPPVFSLMLANRYAEFLGDTATIEGLRKRFEALIGPVRKTGGVR